jgi:uncharacterized protein YacL
LVFISFDFFYLILWGFIPNNKKIDQKKLIKNQLLGIFIGGVLGALIFGRIYYIDSTYANYKPSHDKVIGIIMSVILGFPFGMIVGFTISRIFAEKPHH